MTYEYYDGKFPYSTDMVITLPNGARGLIGRHSYGIELIKVRTWGPSSSFQIGRFCSIAHCEIFLGGNHPKHHIAQGLFLPKFFESAASVEELVNGDVRAHASKGDVTIGSDVWIGSQSTILSGVKIGDGAVVAANSVVTKNVPNYAIVGGNPAKILKLRFSGQILQLLEEIKWWELSDSFINANLLTLRSEPTTEKLLLLLKKSKDEDRSLVPSLKDTSAT